MGYYYFVAFLFLIILIAWQGKVVFKYLKCDVLKINTFQKTILANNHTMLFDDIEKIDVELIKKPNFAERYFTRYAHLHTMYKIIFNMKDMSVQEYVVNSTGILYKYLNTLKPYIQINADIEAFKPKFVDGPVILGFSLVILYVLIKFLNG